MAWSLTSPAHNGSWPLQAKSKAGVRSCFYSSQELQEFRSCRMETSRNAGKNLIVQP
jgi:hypothetical protein